MKVNPVKNDPTTVKDEIVLTIITLCAFAIGIALVVFRPSFWFIGANDTCVIGVLFIMLGVMYTPAIIYRFMTNHTRKK